MKHRILTLVLLLAATAATVQAQEKLAVGRFFSGDFTSKDGVTAVTVSGKKLRPLNLSLYRSVSVESGNEATPQMESAVKADGRSASSREVQYRDGQLYFGFYTLPPVGNEKRYLFFLNSDKAPTKVLTASPRTTLIYMEGQATSDQIRTMLKQK